LMKIFDFILTILSAAAQVIPPPPPLQTFHFISKISKYKNIFLHFTHNQLDTKLFHLLYIIRLFIDPNKDMRQIHNTIYFSTIK